MILNAIEAYEETVRQQIMPDADCVMLDEPRMWRAKICDVLCARNHSILEINMGNKLFEGVYENCVNSSRKILKRAAECIDPENPKDIEDFKTAQQEIEYPFSVMK